MAKRNGTWKVMVTVGSFIIVIIGSAIAYGMLCKTVTDMEPEVKKNTEHRIRFEEKVSTMEANIGLILEEVRKE